LQKDFSEFVQAGRHEAKTQTQEIISRLSTGLADARLREASLMRSLYEEHKLAAELKLSLEQAEARLANCQAQLSYVLDQRTGSGPGGSVLARVQASSLENPAIPRVDLPSIPSFDEFSVRESEYWDMRQQLESSELEIERLRGAPHEKEQVSEDIDSQSGLTYREIVSVLLARLDELSGRCAPVDVPLHLD